MSIFTRNLEIRWSDLDPNFHIRHSVYYDFGAYCRMAFLNEQGITASAMQEYHVGPIIFREECIFRSEIRFGDQVTIDLQLAGVSEDYRKFAMRHQVFKNGDTLAAVMNIEGAWMNTELRKVAVPPDIFISGFNTMHRSDDFQIIPSKK